MLLSHLLLLVSSAATGVVASQSPLQVQNQASSSSKPNSLAKTLLNPNFCAVPNGSIEDACGATYDAVEYTNHRVRPILKSLVSTDFFRFYYLDLYGDSCPLGNDNGQCGNRACAVDTVEDEEDLPEIWRASYLGRLNKDTISTEGQIGNEEDDVELSCVKNADDSLASGGRLNKHAQAAWDKSCKDKNYCVPEDDRTGPDGVYVSLLDNPERYTGYNGPHAHLMWRSVYQQNCFGYVGESISRSFLAGEEVEPASADDSTIKSASVVDSTDVNKNQDMCIEQRLFYRLVSGMHASVSTHLCYSYLDKVTGEWGPDLDCFMSRVGNHPERLSNLYFDYALVSRAVAKLFKYIDDLQFCPLSQDYDQATRRQILLLARSAGTSPAIFNETNIFSTPEAKVLKEEFRQRFHKVSALMDCVGCDRCRLWGKLQAAGYGTALKIVFELNEVEDELSRKLIASLRRSELVSLVNTFDRLSKSIEAVEYFRGLVQKEISDPDMTAEKFVEEKVKAAEEKLKKKNFRVPERNSKDSKPKVDEPPKKQTIWDDPEWELWKEAFGFVLQSYIDFPKNLYNILLMNANHYWNSLIGRDEALAKDRVQHRGHLETINADL